MYPYTVMHEILKNGILAAHADCEIAAAVLRSQCEQGTGVLREFVIDAITAFCSFDKAFWEFHKSYRSWEPGRLPVSAKTVTYT